MCVCVCVCVSIQKINVTFHTIAIRYTIKVHFPPPSSALYLVSPQSERRHLDQDLQPEEQGDRSCAQKSDRGKSGWKVLYEEGDGVVRRKGREKIRNIYIYIYITGKPLKERERESE